MSAPLDVLAWLDSLHVTDADGAVTNRKWPEAQEARAAVAELIEADKEYDAAKLAFNATHPGTLRDKFVLIRARWYVAKERRAAALARVGGVA